MRLAIIVAGPTRYVDYVLKYIESSNLEYDIYVYLWLDEKGNKKRARIINNYDSIFAHERVAKVLFSKPLDEALITERFGLKSNSNSRVYNTVSMFTSLSETINVIIENHKEIPYTHILRLRTDQVINQLFMPLVESLMDTKNFNTSFNPNIPETWVSDHVILAPFEQFITVFSWDNQLDLKKWYNKSNKNPEALIAMRLKEYRLEQSKQFLRGAHYEIVYKEMIEGRSLSDLYRSFFDRNIDNFAMSKSVNFSMLSKVKRWILKQPR